MAWVASVWRSWWGWALTPARVLSCLPSESAALLGGRVASLAGVELGELDLERLLDLGGAFREPIQQPVRDTGDLSLTVDELTERDAVAGGELTSQHRLIQPTQRTLIALQGAGVECQPAPIIGLHLGRNHDMRMQLRIIQPGRRLTEHRRRQTQRLRMQTEAVVSDPRRRPVALNPFHDRRHGDVMTLRQTLVAGQGPPHRQRLR